MASKPRNELQRALRDLSEAISAVFGLERSNPGLVVELLQSRDVAPASRRAPARSRRPRGAHLALVE